MDHMLPWPDQVAFDRDGTPLHPPEPGILTPLEIYVPKVMLIRVLEETLARLRENRSGATETPEEKARWDLFAQQRLDFLKWVRNHPGDDIYMAMYPVDLTDPEDALPDDVDETLNLLDSLGPGQFLS
jgi:hypothetical protein